MIAHQRESRSEHDGNIGAADDLEQAQGVRDFFVPPLVPGHHGYSQHFHLRRLDHQQDSLHIAAARAGTILVDDYFAAGLSAWPHPAGPAARKSSNDRPNFLRSRSFSRSGKFAEATGVLLVPGSEGES